MAEPRPLDSSHPLWGRDLRHAALLLLDRWGPASIGDLLAALGAGGFEIAAAQPNKVLSDALRVEVRRGRVRRTGWGRYAFGRLARTTAWRVRMRWERATGRGASDARPSPARGHGPGGRTTSRPAAPWDPFTAMLQARPWTAPDGPTGDSP